ncbi:alpha/beta hydrolase [Gramella sp. GC03-9]|uniref:Alpha/beta hydrolase n=1 Tax=Christiangramia oceanisediminis TaxID=2920386 RepID=A0A9X2RDL5_9FLAO|nr:alpha/beta hydrolase [Gramella oceanisediminis]MCP9200726.1 alpha/beta hydrolase [Gramella oceanisediminis]
MKKSVWIPGLILLILIIGYVSGPVPQEPVYSYDLPELPSDFQQLDNFIVQKEKELPVREDNQARIKWYDSNREKTEYSIVYLHGFAGSYMDGYPVNQIIADTLKANLYLSRWAGHGLKPPHSLDNFSPENAWESAREALAIGNRIGEKTIILSTSTGGTLATKLAASYPEKVYALINLSPNFEDDQPGTFILNSPWGYDIANIVSFGENKKIDHEQDIARKYWDTIYPSRALVDLQLLVESTMLPAVFKEVTCPVLTLYYHKNFIEEDQHVEVDFFRDVHELLSTPDSTNVLKPLETPGTHFIGSDIKSKDTQVVVREIINFLTNNLQIEL